MVGTVIGSQKEAYLLFGSSVGYWTRAKHILNTPIVKSTDCSVWFGIFAMFCDSASRRMQRPSEVIACCSAAKVGLIYFDHASNLTVVYTNAMDLDHMLCRTLGVPLRRVDS